VNSRFLRVGAFLCLSLSIVAVFLVLREGGSLIPLPFFGEGSFSLLGDLTMIGRKNATDIYRVSFSSGTTTQTLQQDKIYLISVPDASNVHVVPFDLALTVGSSTGHFVNYFGYKYTDIAAAEERLHADDGVFLNRFPGQFFVSEKARAEDAAHGGGIASFEERNGITMLGTSGSGSMQLARGALYMLVVNETEPVTINIHYHCGDGVRTAEEQCDDGNVIDGDGCSMDCHTELGWACHDVPVTQTVAQSSVQSPGFLNRFMSVLFDNRMVANAESSGDAAVCGNARCEIGEIGTIRLSAPYVASPTGSSMESYSNMGVGVTYLGSDANGRTLIGVRGTHNVSYGDSSSGWSTTHTEQWWNMALTAGGGYEWLNEGIPIMTSGTGYPQYYSSDTPAYLGTIDGQPTIAYVSLSDGLPSGAPPLYPRTHVANVDLYTGLIFGNNPPIPFVGSGVVPIGDIDGNGYPDFLTQAATWDSSGITGHQLSVMLLRREGSTLSGTIVPIIGAPSSAVGNITVLGDMNSDGRPEIAVDGTENNVGSVWILSLNADMSVASQSRITPNISFSTGTEEDFYVQEFGAILTGVGDWDGDSIPDLVVGTSGGTLGGDGVQHDAPLWVLFLNQDKTVKSVRVIHSSDVGPFHSWWDGLQTFTSLTSIPDSDGDGRQELVIGDPHGVSCIGLAGQYAAGAHVFFSKALESCPQDCNQCIPPASAAVTQASSQLAPPTESPPPTCNDGTCTIGEWNPIVIPGPLYRFSYASSDYQILSMGKAAIADLGDFDRDGFQDIVVATSAAGYEIPSDPSLSVYHGEVDLISLTASGTQKTIHRIFEGTGGFVTGNASAQTIGAAVEVVGDIDGDGVEDLAVTAGNMSNTSAHSLYILFLSRNGTVKSWRELTPSDMGTVNSRNLGAALTSLGDFDGDGVPDLAVGDPAALPTETWSGPAGSVHLLLLNRDGSVKTVLHLNAASFYGTAAVSSANLAAGHFGAPLAYFGDLFGDGRKLLIVGNMEIFFNADNSINGVKQLSMALTTGLENMGDMNGDGKDDLGVMGSNVSFPGGSTTPIITPSGTIGYFSMMENGDLESLTFYNVAGYAGLDASASGIPSFTSIADVDKDGRRELVISHQAVGFCTTGVAGNTWLLLSGERANLCSDDCNSVNFCSPLYQNSSSSSLPANPVKSVCEPVCGDGLIFGAEQCDDYNTGYNDGCDGMCQIESGWNCAGQPSVCTGGT
jgi:cysteine-rich repeat protein